MHVVCSLRVCVDACDVSIPPRVSLVYTLPPVCTSGTAPSRYVSFHSRSQGLPCQGQATHVSVCGSLCRAEGPVNFQPDAKLCDDLDATAGWFMSAEVILSLIVIMDAMAITVGLSWLAAEEPKARLSVCFGGMSISVATFTALARLVLAIGCWASAAESNDGLAAEVNKQLRHRGVQAFAEASDVDVGPVFLLIATLISLVAFGVTCISARRRTEQDGTLYTRHTDRNPAVPNRPSLPPQSSAPATAPYRDEERKPTPERVVVGAIVSEPLSQDAAPAPKPVSAAVAVSPTAVPVVVTSSDAPTATTADAGDVMVSVELQPATGPASPARRASGGYVPPTAATSSHD